MVVCDFVGASKRTLMFQYLNRNVARNFSVPDPTRSSIFPQPGQPWLQPIDPENGYNSLKSILIILMFRKVRRVDPPLQTPPLCFVSKVLQRVFFTGVYTQSCIHFVVQLLDGGN